MNAHELIEKAREAQEELNATGLATVFAVHEAFASLLATSDTVTGT